MSVGNPLNYFNRAGWPFISLFIVLTAIFYEISMPLYVVGLVLTAWCFYFFRDPTRITPVGTGLIVSPADGRVIAIKEVVPEAALELGDEPRIRVSIFLNVFNVHVNRIPTDGIIRARNYREGKFFNASLDKASEDNERMALSLELTGEHPYKGKLLGVVQIAGLIARRIVCHAKVGDNFKAGERFGIIRFGSRTDVYLPKGVVPLVSIGQTMIGAETVIADFTSTEAARQGEVRE